jgi:DNA-binding CsgD family transcriptional regulator
LIKAFAETVGCRIFELDDTLSTAPDIEFREKEKEVLRWTSDGKTSEEIGRILNVTADAVNFHLRNIQSNRVQAVTYAVAQGYIECPVSQILFLFDGVCCRHAALPDDNSHSSKEERIGETGHQACEKRLSHTHLVAADCDEAGKRSGNQVDGSLGI